jgi:hypothetical protein
MEKNMLQKRLTFMVARKQKERESRLFKATSPMT